MEIPIHRYFHYNSILQTIKRVVATLFNTQFIFKPFWLSLDKCPSSQPPSEPPVSWCRYLVTKSECVWVSEYLTMTMNCWELPCRRAGLESIFSDCGQANIFTGSEPPGRARPSNRLVMESCLTRPASLNSLSVRNRRIVAFRSAQSLAECRITLHYYKLNIHERREMHFLRMDTGLDQINVRDWLQIHFCTLYFTVRNKTTATKAI